VLAPPCTVLALELSSIEIATYCGYRYYCGIADIAPETVPHSFGRTETWFAFSYRSDHNYLTYRTYSTYLTLLGSESLVLLCGVQKSR